MALEWKLEACASTTVSRCYRMRCGDACKARNSSCSCTHSSVNSAVFSTINAEKLCRPTFGGCAELDCAGELFST